MAKAGFASARAKGSRQKPGWSFNLGPGHKQEKEGQMAKDRLVLETSRSQPEQKMCSQVQANGQITTGEDQFAAPRANGKGRVGA